MTRLTSLGTQCWESHCSSLFAPICCHPAPSMCSRISGAPTYAVRGEVVNGQVGPHQRMAVTLVEGSILPFTAQTARADPPGVAAIVAWVGAVAVPFQWRPCQGQGKQALHASKGWSLQIDELVWPTSKGVWSHNGVKSVQDHVFYNSATHAPVTSMPVHLASSGDYLSCNVTQMPSRLASAELGMPPESYEHCEQ